MKKIILAIAAITFIGSTSFAAINTDKEKEEKINKLNTACKTEMKEMGLEQAQADKFCDCYTKQIGEKFTIEEITAVEELNEAEKEPSTELVQKLQEAMMPCAAEMQQ